MLEKIMKEHGIDFKDDLSREKKKEEMIKYLQFQADCCGSIQDSLYYLNDIRKIKEA